METISDRIFELLKERRMSQKEFSQKTGIAESTISDWKRKRTNPVSDRILIISEVLEVSPYDLLSGAEQIGERSRDNKTYVISKETELGILIETYQGLNHGLKKQLMGYLTALEELNRNQERMKKDEKKEA
ncbi:MAG: helix-turn-helix domain-containing protein [Fusicatenibacter sp.]